MKLVAQRGPRLRWSGHGAVALAGVVGEAWVLSLPPAVSG
jgi:hypothetical protein